MSRVMKLQSYQPLRALCHDAALGSYFHTPRGRRRDGFTLIELLVVIAIIANLKVRNLFAINHKKSSTFGFADGHADFKKWLNPATFAIVPTGAIITAPNNQDIEWFMTHCTVPR
jgi:prepilin-type N-terminal cleavage/methylation domain-containing protein/prepilin-type processing-associated H-X9-DG protein